MGSVTEINRARLKQGVMRIHQRKKWITEGRAFPRKGLLFANQFNGSSRAMP